MSDDFRLHERAGWQYVPCHPMRVLFVANTLPPADISGVGEQVLQLAAGLRELGHTVHVLGRGRGGARGPKSLFPLTVVPAVVAEVRRFRPEVVQVHESDGGLVVLVLRLLAPFLGLPRPRLDALLQVSYREERRAVRPLRDRDGRVLGRPGAVERRFRWWKAPLQILLGGLTARWADRVLAPSAATAREIERDYLPARRAGTVRVVPNVTGGLVVPAAEPELEPPGYLLFVGRLRIRKGVEVLLEALARLEDRGLGVRLLIAGDGEHRAALEARATALGLDAAVRFLGRAGAGRVRTLLAGARALVVPSIYEGMPLVVLEAMAAGLPIVASRVSGIPEVVLDGETGTLVPAEDVAALAEAVAGLWADPAEARRRGEAGRRRVEECFRPEIAARLWLAGSGG
ncbi:MAG: glycosyltransferase family 4 protein [Thermoanaerobaculia bacterium]|nr:glycosyltransferase family 4 protein [Thermoanaerobaculia bacterium]